MHHFLDRLGKTLSKRNRLGTEMLLQFPCVHRISTCWAIQYVNTDTFQHRAHVQDQPLNVQVSWLTHATYSKIGEKKTRTYKHTQLEMYIKALQRDKWLNVRARKNSHNMRNINSQAATSDRTSRLGKRIRRTLWYVCRVVCGEQLTKLVYFVALIGIVRSFSSSVVICYGLVSLIFFSLYTTLILPKTS